MAGRILKGRHRQAPGCGQTINVRVATTTYSSLIAYDTNGDPITTTLKTGSITATEVATYDNSSRLQQLTESDPVTGTSGLTNTYSYGYDGLNRTSSITAKVNGASTSTTVNHDALGEVILAGTKSYTYTASQNLSLVTGSGITETYSYATQGQPDELTSYTATGKSPLYFTYDTNGTIAGTTVISSGGLPRIISTNPLSMSDCLAGQSDAHSTCLAYDSQDRLSQVKLSNGSTVSMSYNTAGERAGYTVVLSGSTTLQELFTYRGDQVGQVIYSGTSITDTYTDTYVYLGDSSPYELIRQYTSKVTCGGQSTLTCKYFYVLDGRGNVVALVDKTGTVVDRYSYDVWGVPTISLETVKQPLLYAGYWYDRELGMPGEATGWYWLSVRPYDPVLERFLQPDPSQIEGLRSYVYAGDDPVDWIDPSGDAAQPVATSTPTATPAKKASTKPAVAKPQVLPTPTSNRSAVTGLDYSSMGLAAGTLWAFSNETLRIRAWAGQYESGEFGDHLNLHIQKLGTTGDSDLFNLHFYYDGEESTADERVWRVYDDVSNDTFYLRQGSEHGV